MRFRLLWIAALAFLLSIFATSVLTPSVAFAQDEAAEEEEEGEYCEEGMPTTKLMLSLGGLVLGTVVVGFAGLQTVSRSLAAGGSRQSAANMAGMGLGALVGGGIGAGLVGYSCQGVGVWPGFLSIGVAAVGLLLLVLGIATGKS